jgi:tetratricopeptide (TPR) repeat protein
MRDEAGAMRFTSGCWILIGALVLLAACSRGTPGPGGGDEGDAATAPAGVDTRLAGDAMRGLLLFRQGQLIAAEPHLQAALEAAPDDRRLLEALGAIYALSDRPAEAEPLLRRATAESPSSFGAWFHLARVLSDTGREEEALQAIREARRRDPRPVAGMIEEARLLTRVGRYDEAEPIAREAIARNPGVAEPHVVLARCLQERGALDDAAATLRDAIAAEPDHLGALSRLVTIEMRRGNVEEAERARQAHREALALRRVADRVRGPRRNAVAAFGRGDYDEALDTFRAVARETPDDPQVHLHIGATLIALQRYDEALDALRLCLDLDPREARAYTEISRLHALEGRIDEAFEALQQAVELNPDDPEPHYVRAGLHRARGEEELYTREMQRFEELRARFGETAEPSPVPGAGEVP